MQKQQVAKKFSFEPSNRADEKEASTRLTSDETVNRPAALLGLLGQGAYFHGLAMQMEQLPDRCVALVATSIPPFIRRNTGSQKNNQEENTWNAYRKKLFAVLAECKRVLEPGGRMAINLAFAGDVAHKNLSIEIISLLRDELKLLSRGEIVWEKSRASAGAHVWGSFAKASDPLLRVTTERIIVVSKESLARALTVKERRDQGLPFESTITNDEFLEAARDLWRIGPVLAEEEAFPLELPKRLIDLYTYEGDIVLDPFAGSGATLVAAAAAGRIGVGYDADALHVARGQQRLAGEVGPLLRKRAKYSKAVSVASSAKDIAKSKLETAGFFVLESKKYRSAAECVLFDFCVKNTYGQSWWVDVVGGYSGVKPGMTNFESVLELIGRSSIASSSERAYPVLALTSALPLRGSMAQKALAAVGPEQLFDVIDLLDLSGLERLTHYGDGGAQLPGFWMAADLSRV